MLLNGKVAPMRGRREGKDIQHCSTISPIQLNFSVPPNLAQRTSYVQNFVLSRYQLEIEGSL